VLGDDLSQGGEGQTEDILGNKAYVAPLAKVTYLDGLNKSGPAGLIVVEQIPEKEREHDSTVREVVMVIYLHIMDMRTQIGSPAQEDCVCP
jgi:hypothetical protein